MHPIFKIRERETPEIVALLNSVTLGTNGAHYRHLDTTERIKECDNPLFLSMERREKVIGNVTFCRRGADWYVRYFAFDPKLQSTGSKQSSNKDGLLKRELNAFFAESLRGDGAYDKVDSFYAYIDPNNEKSLWMSENFGFKTIGKIATQTYSRVNPKPSSRLEKVNDWSEVSELVNSQFGKHKYFFTEQTNTPPFYLIRNNEGEIIAFLKMSISTWEIKRLPGKMGGFLTKIIPFIPRLNKLIRPKKHSFVVPEAVYVKNNDQNLLDELFHGVLSSEQKNLMIWWVDEKDDLYLDVKDQMKWGLLNKLIGVSVANLVQRANSVEESKGVFYTSGFDFI